MHHFEQAKATTFTPPLRIDDPANRLGPIVAGVDNIRNILHDDISGFMPFLNSIMLDLDLTCMNGPMLEVELDGGVSGLQPANSTAN